MQSKQAARGRMMRLGLSGDVALRLRQRDDPDQHLRAVREHSTASHRSRFGPIETEGFKPGSRAKLLQGQAGQRSLSSDGAEDPRGSSQGSQAGRQVVPESPQRHGSRHVSQTGSTGDAASVRR